jgi:hypothetical protein
MPTVQFCVNATQGGSVSARIVVRPGNATAHLVRRAWVEVLEEASKSDSPMRKEVVDLGIDPDILSKSSVEVSEDAGDFGATLVIAIAAPVAAHILKSLWDDQVRPRLRAWNADVGPDVDSGPDTP